MSKQDDVIGYFFGPAIFSSDNTTSIDITGRTTNREMICGIIDGTTRGLSPEMKIGWYQCTICLQNYENCPHDVGKNYSEKPCQLMPRDTEVITQSVVSMPKDPKARVTDLLIIEKKGSQTMFTWHGFGSDKENRRFQHIQSAKDSGHISEKIALKFVNFYLEQFIGSTTYSSQ